MGKKNSNVAVIEKQPAVENTAPPAASIDQFPVVTPPAVENTAPPAPPPVSAASLIRDAVKELGEGAKASAVVKLIKERHSRDVTASQVYQTVHGKSGKAKSGPDEATAIINFIKVKEASKEYGDIGQLVGFITAAKKVNTLAESVGGFEALERYVGLVQQMAS